MTRKVLFLQFSLLLLPFLTTHAHFSYKYADSIPVKVKDWRQRSIYFTEVFYDRIEQEVSSKIGKEEFEKFKSFSGTNSWPEAMQYKMEWRKDTAATSAFYARMNKLKMFKVLDFELKRDDGVVQYFSIIKVPHANNIDWNPTAVWNDVYFLFQKQFVTE